MSITSKLSRAAVAFVNAFESAERNYVKVAAPFLADLQEQAQEEGIDVASLWRDANSESYEAAKLTPHTPKYQRLAKLNSMLLAVAIRNAPLFAQYVAGDYPCSLQLAYKALPKSKKSATRKVSVAQKLADTYTVAQLRRALEIALAK